MIKKLYISILFSFSCITASAQNDNLLYSLENVYAKVQINSGEVGSGFVVGTSKDSVYLVTAEHVISELEKRNLTISFIDDTNHYHTMVLFSSARDDVALLAAKRPFGWNWKKIEMTNSLSVEEDLCFVYVNDRKEFKRSKTTHLDDINPSFDRFMFMSDEVIPGQSGNALYKLKDSPVMVGMIIQMGNPDVAVPIKFIRHIIPDKYKYTWQLNETDN